jgi:hypothetical protein
MIFRVVLFFLFFQIIETLCPNQSIQYQTNCFLFNTTRLAFARAEISCNEAGGHLVSLHDAFSNAVIGEYSPDYFTDNDYWVGGDKFLSQGTWSWTDGTNFDFTDWKKGEPQNLTGYDCVALSVKDGYWSAQECFQTKPFVCNLKKMNSTILSTTTAATTTKTTYRPTSLPVDNCTPGWIYFKNSCYYFNRSASYLSWDDSENYCKTMGAHSASIHSENEKSFVYNLVYDLNPVWLGLYSDDSGKTLNWTDGTPVDYISWRGGYPSFISGRNCILLGWTADNISGFVVYPCNGDDYPLYSLCKKPSIYSDVF